MTRELFLARRLIEAVVDPDASQAEADEAVAELAEVCARLDVPSGRTLSIQTFVGMTAADLSPAAWLYLLENRNENEPELPPDILDSLFLEYSDPAVRLRLVSGALGQPHTRARYADALGRQPAPVDIDSLPDSWPKRRIDALQVLAETPEGLDSPHVRQGLQEFVLYLLQDGSDAALALAAGAIASDESWRKPAWDLARSIVLGADSELESYGRAFRRTRIRD